MSPAQTPSSPPGSLFPLFTLHAAAPGVLNVVFGPDGDFEGAPHWAGPMTSLANPSRCGWLVWRGALHVSVGTSDGHWSSTVEQWRERWALDLRIPSVAARLAGLCALTLTRFGTPDPQTVWISYDGNGLIHLMVEDRSLYSLEHDPFWTDDGNIDYGAFVRAMVLDLAPKIAALP